MKIVCNVNMKLFAALAFFYCVFLGGAEPEAVYITWAADPTSSMVVCWHTDLEINSSDLWYRLEGGQTWRQIKGWIQEVAEAGLRIHAVELEGLQPASRYEFRFTDNGQMYRFRTLPVSGSTSVRFAVGGDAFFDEERFHAINRDIASQNVDFVVVGGDIAYTTGERFFPQGRRGQANRWHRFFKIWHQDMVTKEGCLIPIVPVVGNHDVSELHSTAKKELFFDMFALQSPYRTYRSVRLGSYATLLLLDTGHVYDIEGEQARWLKAELEKVENGASCFPIYHVAAYPAYYAPKRDKVEKIRKAWIPLFEQAGIKFVFEHHNHCYKRTWPLKNGKKDPDGIIFLGDGSWGVMPRRVDTNRDYLAKALSINSYFLVTLQQGLCQIEPRGVNGQAIDDVISQHFALKASR